VIDTPRAGRVEQPPMISTSIVMRDAVCSIEMRYALSRFDGGL
jgi:hypothetical protein